MKRIKRKFHISFDFLLKKEQQMNMIINQIQQLQVRLLNSANLLDSVFKLVSLLSAKRLAFERTY